MIKSHCAIITRQPAQIPAPRHAPAPATSAVDCQSPSTVPYPLSREYGEFASRVPFKELQAAILALGHTIELDKRNTSSDMACYRVSASAARMHVVSDPDP
ncbi:hypothetical protein ABT236_18910 [Streptomyces sp. NPDC001523]|uniref:hypothetical protein n=1 Tax=Streptomyces sp. NPDC001523 TaxID=3154383 RepID=UPI0033322145